MSDTATTIYVGGVFEKVTGTGGTEEKNYIMTPTGRVAVATFGTAVPVGGTVQYFHTDGLGSITAVTDETGAVVKRFAYDSWGKQIDPASGDRITSATNGHVTRGYTDHEMLADLGLVHMNGRIYDPVLGRFLSADPNVDGTYDSQGYNRYSYVGNNPMGFTDPSGHLKLWKDVLGPIVQVVAAYYLGPWASAAVGATINGWKGAAQGYIAGYGGNLSAAAGGSWQVGYAASSGFSGSLLNGGSIGDAFKAGVIGGAQAYAAGQIGDHFGHDIGSFWNEAGRATAHGVLGGFVEEARGGQFRNGFYAGFVGSVAGSIVGTGALGKMGGPEGIVLRTTIAAVAGGTAAELGGGKFANGALTAAFQHLFNHEGVRLKQLMRQQMQLIQDMRELDETITMGEYVSEAHKLATSIVEWVGIGKTVSGGFKMLRGVGSLLSKMRLGGYTYEAQKVLNASYAEEAARKVIVFAAEEGGQEVAQGTILYGLSKAANDFGDALNHGQGTLQEAYRVRQQLESQYDQLTGQINELISHR